MKCDEVSDAYKSIMPMVQKGRGVTELLRKLNRYFITVKCLGLTYPGFQASGFDFFGYISRFFPTLFASSFCPRLIDVSFK